MGVGTNLKEILRNRKMTIKQLSEKADVPLNTLYSITKRDSERVDRVILNRIAAALGVDPYSLYSFDQASDALVDRIETQEQISKDCERMNDEGLKLAGELVHLVAEAPRYRAETTPQSPPAPTEGKNTTPPPDAPETASEGE